MSNESSTTPLNLLQDCILAGGATNSDDINMQRKCQQQLRDGESTSTPFHNFMDILRGRATSSTSVFTSNYNSKANAYSNMRQDFNISSKVWQ